MDKPGGRSRRHPDTHRVGVALVLLALVSGSAFAACSEAHPGGGDATAMTMPTMHGNVLTVDPGAAAAAARTGAAPAPPVAAEPMPDAEAMWAARPDYVDTTAATEAAYHYAVTHPEIVQWMPCYCGCGGMGHGSNLDCYLRRADGTFDEHASYCDICVQITLTTKELVSQGKSLREIRQVVDQIWGGRVPGTPTALPPV